MQDAQDAHSVGGDVVQDQVVWMDNQLPRAGHTTGAAKVWIVLQLASPVRNQTVEGDGGGRIFSADVIKNRLPVMAGQG